MPVWGENPMLEKHERWKNRENRRMEESKNGRILRTQLRDAALTSFTRALSSTRLVYMYTLYFSCRESQKYLSKMYIFPKLSAASWSWVHKILPFFDSSVFSSHRVSANPPFYRFSPLSVGHLWMNKSKF